MPKNVPAGVLTILATRKYSLANLFTITPKIGSPLYYTDADVNVTAGGNMFLFGGMTGPYFNPKSGGNRARGHWKVGVEVDSIVFDVLPGTGTVNGVDFKRAINLGYFDKATVQIDRAPMSVYGDASAGVIPIFLGYVGDIDAGDSIVTFNVNGGSILLQRPYPVDVYQPGCIRTLFDTNCTLSPSNFVSTGTAVSATTASQINTSSLAAATGYYDGGRIQFTSGQNVNFSRAVKAYTLGSPSTITLQSPFPFTPAISDTFNIWPGCDKLQTTCDTKFNNLENYGGFDYIPDTNTAI